MNIIQPALWLLLGSALALQQDLGIVFVQEWTNAGQKTMSTTLIDGARLRQESGIGSSNHEVQIFDARQQVLRTLDPEHKSYIELTKEYVDEVQGTLKTEGAKYVYRRTGTRQVAQWPCTIYEVFRPDVFGGAIKDSEICIADLSQFKITASDLSVSRELYEFGWRYSLWSYGMMLVGPSKFPLTETRDLSGVPVLRIRFALDGSIATTSELKEFRREIIPPSLFEVPADFGKLSPSGPFDVDAPLLPPRR